MKLISLVTNNFKKLGDASFNFTEGLNVIVGDNGHGKSSLLQAIEAALYGVTVIPGKKEKVPTWGQTKFSLELSFVANDGRTLLLTRTHSTAKLVKIAADADDDELLANGNTPVTAYIEELLGLTAKDYNLFVQSKQGETAGILTFGAAALSRKVEEFAGIDVIDAVQVKANERANVGTALANSLTAKVEEVAGAEVALADAVQKVSDAQLELNNAEACKPDELEVVWPSPTSEELNRQRREIDKAKGRVDLLNSELKSAQDRMAELESEKWEKPGDPVALQANVDKLRQELLSLAQKADAANEQLRDRQRTDERMAEIEQLAEALVIPEFHARELEAAQEAADEAQAAVNRTSQLVEQREEMVDGANCPTCGTQLSEHDPEKLREELAGLKDAFDLAVGASITCKAEVTRLTALEKEHNTQQQKFEALNEEYEKLEAKVAETQPAADLIVDRDAIAKAHEEKSNELMVERAAVTLLESAIRAYDQHQQKLRTARTNLDTAKTAVEALPELKVAPTDAEIDTAAAAESGIREAQRAHTELVNTYQRDVNETKSALQQVNSAMDAARTRFDQLQGCKEQQTQALGAVDVAKRLSRFLGDRRSNYLQQVWESVMAAASRQVSLSSDGMITKVVYRDGEFLYEEDGVEAPIASASGAQKAHIGVSIKIGLARALYGSDSLLIFDEPTESMSERHAAGLAASLAGTAKQIFLITHREQDQALANNIIAL